jgi:hypothetical protein
MKENIIFEHQILQHSDGVVSAIRMLTSNAEDQALPRPAAAKELHW